MLFLPFQPNIRFALIPSGETSSGKADSLGMELEPSWTNQIPAILSEKFSHWHLFDLVMRGHIEVISWNFSFLAEPIIIGVYPCGLMFIGTYMEGNIFDMEFGMAPKTIRGVDDQSPP